MSTTQTVSTVAAALCSPINSSIDRLCDPLPPPPVLLPPPSPPPRGFAQRPAPSASILPPACTYTCLTLSARSSASASTRIAPLPILFPRRSTSRSPLLPASTAPSARAPSSVIWLPRKFSSSIDKLLRSKAAKACISSSMMFDSGSCSTPPVPPFTDNACSFTAWMYRSNMRLLASSSVASASCTWATFFCAWSKCASFTSTLSARFSLSSSSTISSP
mmetsp:Transcript_8422/g.13956  ORF Transcript_8422/g.13956 Transcript_8422/m.13956 type:complete len:219 (+) Transcript_8422:1153-1809(+)